MDILTEDDFWNTSSHSGFNFDDDEDIKGIALNNTILQSSTSSSLILPVNLIISNQSLKFILNDVKPSVQVQIPSEFLSISHQLIIDHNYIRFNDKIKILQKSLETGDGNVIIKIILYLKRTLKPNIFYHQLSKRKLALKHYVNYLFMKNKLNEISDLYMATGNNINMKYLYFHIGYGISNKTTLNRKLQQFINEHLQKFNSYDDKINIYDNLNFTKFQTENNLNSNCIITQLVELCKIELSTQKSMDKIIEFKKAFKIDDFSYDWTLLNVLASIKLWQQITDLYIKNNWLTKKSVLKTVITPEIFLIALGRHHPPHDTLELLLKSISDIKKAFQLAEKLQCPNYIIQYYITQGDRLALRNYKEKVLHQSPQYYLIENALQNL